MRPDRTAIAEVLSDSTVVRGPCAVIISATSGDVAFIVRRDEGNAQLSLKSRFGTSAQIEGAVLRDLARDPAISPHLPALERGCSLPDGHLLHYPAEQRPLDVVARGQPAGQPIPGAAALGSTLALIHSRGMRDSGNFVYTRALDAVFTNMPWIFDAGAAPAAWIATLSGANIELLGILAGYPTLLNTIADERERWRHTGLVHGDLFFRNVLIAAPDASADRSLTIIDWELASFGEPLWDAASVLTSGADHWLRYVVELDRSATEAVAADIERYAAAARRFNSVFWSSYVDMRVRGGAHVSDLDVSRVMRYCSMRLVELAFAHTRYSGRPTARSHGYVAIAAELARRPMEGAVQLFGLHPGFNA